MSKGETDIDVLILLTTVALAGFSLFMVSPAWGFFGICFIGSLGIWEFVSKVRTGKSLTQRFKALMRDPKKRWKAILAVVALDLFFIYLNLHLLCTKGIWG